MPILLLIYVVNTDAKECWPGFTWAAFRNWGPMLRLALPGLVMIMAEFLAFEILTLASANFSATHLGANTVLQSLSVMTYQLPFPLSIAGSTRVANLVGAGLPEAGKCTAKVMLVIGAVIGIFNMLALSIFREQIPHLYTRDPDVIALAAKTLPVNAAFQLWDALAAQCNGIMRGLGKQAAGGLISLVVFYGVSKIPPK
jgi:MATE family multidrug resistance protein